MEITGEKVARFFKQDLPAEEAEVVAAWLQENPEMAAEWLAPDWDEKEEEVVLSDKNSQSLYAQIRSESGIRSMQLRKKMYTWAAAAILAVVAGSGIWLLQRRQGNSMAGTTVKTGKVLPAWVINNNSTIHEQHLALPDGTTVVLYAHSGIRYSQVFEHTRDIYLKGSASFNVAADKAKPFTVYAGAASTTALGTFFYMCECPAGVKVQLYSGKVLVQPVQASIAGWHDKVILMPGQQLAYKQGDVTAAVSLFSKEMPVMAKAPVTAAVTAAPVMQPLLFDRTPVNEVLQTLSDHYQRPIQWNRQEVDSLYFTGKVLPSDSLAVILKIIGRMNGLQINNQNDTLRVQTQ